MIITLKNIGPILIMWFKFVHMFQAKVICKQEYFRWRENGLAFEAREGIYDRPNKSMASGIVIKRVSR